MENGLAGIWQQLSQNQVAICAFLAWITAEIMKYIIDGFRRKRWHIRYFFSSGGMPSSHSAAAIAVTMGVGFHDGFNTSLFVVSGVFAMIVMYDAAGVRRETGRQGSVLNELMDWLATWNSNSPLEDVDMKERVGHSPLEVMAGFLWGLIWALGFFVIGK